MESQEEEHSRLEQSSKSKPQSEGRASMSCCQPVTRAQQESVIPVPHDLLCSHIFGPLRGANGSLKPGRPLEKLSKKLYHNNFECITQFNILGHQGDRLGLLSRPFECCSMAVKNKTFFFSV